MWENALKIMEQFRSKTIYIGCSGGVDSMVLVDFLHKNQFKIHVLHVNYHKRGLESDKDMEFVKKYCEDQSIPHTFTHYTDKKKGNFQQNARDFRYDFFEKKASHDGVIALAHHADDQVETFFMNMMRQSGILGLSSIPVIRGQYVRPLLHLFKSDILNYAQTNNLEWREDLSNQSTHYLRNKWRFQNLFQKWKKNFRI